MKLPVLPWQIALILLALLLVRERDAPWIQHANAAWRDTVLRVLRVENDATRVTFVSSGSLKAAKSRTSTPPFFCAPLQGTAPLPSGS